MSHPPHRDESDAQGAALNPPLSEDEERKPSPVEQEVLMEVSRIGRLESELRPFPNSTSRGNYTTATAAQSVANHANVACSAETRKAPHIQQPPPQSFHTQNTKTIATLATARIQEQTRNSCESSAPSTSTTSQTRTIAVTMSVSKHSPSDRAEASQDSNDDGVVEENQQSKRRRKRANQLKPGQTAGRWTPEEHKAFLEGLKIYGREWKKVADRIPTRTSAQIRSHAQKYFAKMARDEAIMMEQNASSVAQLPTSASLSAGSGGESTEAAVSSNLPPSVQRNVDRILADPEGAQEEVEKTLNELRERYHQLQLRLQDSQTNSPGRDADPVAGANVDIFRPPSFRNQIIDRRKRSLEDAMQPPRQQGGPNQPQQDDLSSVASSVSASLANASIASNREFGNEELIALHVLGGSLPANEANAGSSVGPPPPPGGESPTSSLSSVAQNGSDSGSKRQRYEEERL
mmetsp:Transcript_15905/g.23429  ORF Transcript_15905/g.23429 Transcript_15905/m.23429 type:complete len:462 (-) Transcript_15905:378-1763(-)|eukprot:CAMPEP_0194037418 /NCGR_PEP_ID=MMETSP0009_2-20130614/9761_1 /TAXON_ID=210454 /ORGANISM="Grammatophora oceanica, Strain CCMP 410" /LENGTH=461 /DNA_ID=CAMNT_0038679565 /DNA_START=1564 /DNA_END=2949 /DNA_ORIENTATION=+